MGTLDFTKFERDQVVVHFGGSLASVDAYTFANALIAFADTVRAVNSVVNPGEEIEVRLIAQAPGSYRAIVRKVRKNFKGLLGRGVEAVFWGIVATAIYEQCIKNTPDVQITVNSDEVIIQNGGERVIVPRNAYDALPNVRKSPEVQQSLSQTFRVIERDEAVTDFGLMSKVDDPVPIMVIPRDKFYQLSAAATFIEETEKTRCREERARLVILKAWLTHAKRKWAFEWNGIPISAPIKDDDFLGKIDRRDYLIGSGDALDVVLTYKQNFDEALKVYVNDPNTFVVAEVIRPVPRGGQGRLPS